MFESNPQQTRQPTLSEEKHLILPKTKTSHVFEKSCHFSGLSHGTPARFQGRRISKVNNRAEIFG